MLVLVNENSDTLTRQVMGCSARGAVPIDWTASFLMDIRWLLIHSGRGFDFDYVDVVVRRRHLRPTLCVFVMVTVFVLINSLGSNYSWHTNVVANLVD